MLSADKVFGEEPPGVPDLHLLESPRVPGLIPA